MPTHAWIALLWLGFAATHLLLTSAGVRPRSVARLGEEGHRLVFSLIAVSFALPNLALLLTGRSGSPRWWSPPASLPLELVLFAGMGGGAVLLALSLVQRAPTLLGVDAPVRVRGVLRITRQPMMMGFALLGVSFLLWSGRSTDVAFFGGLAAYALVGAWHQERRYLRDGPPGYRAFHDATSFWPRWPRSRRDGASKRVSLDGAQP